MLQIAVGRRLTQRRSLNEARESVEYLANLPRSIGFTLEAIEVDDPVAEGLLWYYRGIMRYSPKEHEKPERIEKDRAIILERVRRACEHKRWGRAPWYIEEDPTRGSLAKLDSTSNRPFETVGAESLSLSVSDELPGFDVAIARKVWPDLIEKVGDGLGWRLSQTVPVAIVGSDVLVITAKPGYGQVADECGSRGSMQRIERCLESLIHQPVKVKFQRAPVSDEETQNTIDEKVSKSSPARLDDRPAHGFNGAGVGLLAPPTRVGMPPLDLATAQNVWPDLLKGVGAVLGWRLSQVEPTDVVGPDVLVLKAKPGCESVADECGTPTALAKIQRCLEGLIQPPINITYERDPDADEETRDKVDELAEFSATAGVPSSVPELPKEGRIKELAGRFGMISDASRLKIVLILAQQERNVTELCADLGSQSQPAISHHLSILRHARLVEPRREGKHNYYELTDKGRRLAEVVEQVAD